MTKSDQLKEIQKRLPDDITIVDESKFDFTEDEFVSILCWLKVFNSHYRENGKERYPEVLFPIISKRLRLDFGLYATKSTYEVHKGSYNIYISNNEKNYKAGRKSLANFIENWDL
ncbi:hypothetical protein [Elizabethkingia anophelis]|uniref:hypothetical protein n=1 Tax=Elizabethkingia anophelis TaxID=1117645 RepID=UPI00099936C0|nr:hypothetical protein [Elizabethkingia anophelis]AQX90692.1 hypothetical protein AYC67_17480 [Elizabethkingia anophelis]EHM7981851.1 hypothetical protein [Elizabethkingia anophelis]EHZ9535303.1 hypothetical protein [Elizabethkingia anophelis]EKU3673213.1 hypothetical protein [Elizabethkingia anophelis]EKU4210190.1 hypothetical protein [Elizabethkingia anophelis]